MRGIRIDRERAIKLAAMAGLVVLGLSVLPGLLKTPEPPELPPDVGFTNLETGPAPGLPDPGEPPPKRVAKETGSRGQTAPESGDVDLRADRRARPNAHRKRPKPPSRQAHKSKKHRNGTKTVQPQPAAPAPQPAPAPAPAPTTPAPAPAPPPSAPAPPPGDGSQEFAPR